MDVVSKKMMFQQVPVDTPIEVKINNELLWINGYLECGSAQQIDRNDQTQDAIIIKSATYPTVEMWIPLVDISAFRVDDI